MIEGLTFQNLATSNINNGSLHKNGVLGVKEDPIGLTNEQKEVLVYATSDNPLPIILQDISKEIKTNNFFKDSIGTLSAELKEIFSDFSTDITKALKNEKVEEEEIEGPDPFKNDILEATLETSTKLNDIFKVLQILSSKEIPAEDKEATINNIEKTFKETKTIEKENNNETVVQNNSEINNIISEKETNNFKETERIENNNNTIKEIENNNNTETFKEVVNNEKELDVINNNTENNIIQHTDTYEKETENNILKETYTTEKEAADINKENSFIDKNLTLERVLSSSKITEELQKSNEIAVEDKDIFKNILDTLKHNVIQKEKENKKEDKKEEKEETERKVPETAFEKLKDKIFNLSDSIIANRKFSNKVQGMDVFNLMFKYRQGEFDKDIKKKSSIIKETPIEKFAENKIDNSIKENTVIKDKKEIINNENKIINNSIISEFPVATINNIFTEVTSQTAILSDIWQIMNTEKPEEKIELNKEISPIESIEDMTYTASTSTPSNSQDEPLTVYLKEDNKKEEIIAERLYEKLEEHNKILLDQKNEAISKVIQILNDKIGVLLTDIKTGVEKSIPSKVDPIKNMASVNKGPFVEPAMDFSSLPAVDDLATGVFSKLI